MDEVLIRDEKKKWIYEGERKRNLNKQRKGEDENVIFGMKEERKNNEKNKI